MHDAATCGHRHGVFYELKAREGALLAFSSMAGDEALVGAQSWLPCRRSLAVGSPANSACLPLIEPIPNETRHNNRLRKKVALAFTEETPRPVSRSRSKPPSPARGEGIFPTIGFIILFQYVTQL